MHLQVVLARQVLTGQCRSESFPYCAAVLLPQQLHYQRSKLLRFGSIRLPPSTPVLQSPSALLLVSSPDPLYLPIAQTQDLCRIHQLQLFTRYSGHHSHPAQLSFAHPCPSQPKPPQEVFSLGDISNEGIRGHYQSGATIAAW